MNAQQSLPSAPSGLIVQTRTPLDISDDEGISRVPDIVEQIGLLQAPDMVPEQILELSERVDQLVLTSVWWDQSGRPEGDVVKPGTIAWDVMEKLSDAAKAGGVAEGSRLFSTIPPKGHWFSEDNDEASGLGFDADEPTDAEAASAVLDEPRPVVG